MEDTVPGRIYIPSSWHGTGAIRALGDCSSESLMTSSKVSFFTSCAFVPVEEKIRVIISEMRNEFLLRSTLLCSFRTRQSIYPSDWYQIPFNQYSCQYCNIQDIRHVKIICLKLLYHNDTVANTLWFSMDPL
jgi:hypothetical protein